MEQQLEDTAASLTATLLAREDWPKFYLKAPEQHALLLKQTAKFQVLLTRFFREMAKASPKFINKRFYNQQRLDYNINVVVQDDQIDQWDGMFIKVNYSPVRDILLTGAAASAATYDIPMPVPSSSELVQRAAMDRVAALVGKKRLEDGSLIDDPDSEYDILETVRKDIAASVKTSLGLGETTDEATDRIAEIISDPMRAELIAQTESVNAYQAGVSLFGQLSHAVGKEWITAGATDICADYESLGPVEIDYQYGGTLDGPTAHPRCRCAKRLIYAEEWASIGH